MHSCPTFPSPDLINEGGSYIPDLIVTVVNNICAFDEEHKDEAKFVKSETHFQHVVNWIYAASIDADNILPFLVTPSIGTIILEKSK